MASQVQPRHQKEDDITAVLGRFKAWNAALEPHDEPQEGNGFDDVQAISYEEALGERGIRRLIPRAVSAPLVEAPETAAPVREASYIGPLTELESMLASIHDSVEISQPAALAAEATAKPPVQARMAAMPPVPLEKERSVEHSATPKTQQILSPKPAKSSARSSSAKSKTTEAAMTLAARRGTASSSTKASSSAAARSSSSKTGTRSAGTRGVAAPRPQQTFRGAMEESLAEISDVPRARSGRAVKATAGTKGSMVPWVQAKSVSLKLRMSAGEHATIQAGANDAGLTLAAYMRQCTLDVEVLRKLLKQTIADIRAFETVANQPLLTAPVPEPSIKKPSRPGLLKRLRAAWMDRPLDENS